MRKPLPKKLPYKTHFEDDRYKITSDPLNYIIKCRVVSTTRKDKNGNPTLIISDNFYSDIADGLEKAKEYAEYMIKKYS